MQKSWRLICCLAGIWSISSSDGIAFGQEEYEAPQYPQYVQYPQSAPPVAPVGSIMLAPAQIDELIGRIALYPDPLLSLIFPGSTYPQDVVAAEQWLQSTASPTEDAINAQPWDDSIKGLLHYPTVLKMMSDNLDWTQALGAAFLDQPQDVMDAVQRLRAEAQAANNLQSNPQQQIVDDDGAIRIEPIDPDVIYIPEYDPTIVFSTSCPVSFGVGFAIGLWCNNDFDWHEHHVVIGRGWYRSWHHPVEWDRHPPAWDRHPPDWHPLAKPWTRIEHKPPPPRITREVVTRLKLDRPRGTPVARPIVHPVAVPVRRPVEHQPIGRTPEPLPSRNVFDPPTSREEVLKQQQRARPTPARAPVVVHPPEEVHPPVRIEPQPAPRPVAPPPPPRVVEPAPPPVRSAPVNVFSGGSGGVARAQSARGSASVHR